VLTGAKPLSGHSTPIVSITLLNYPPSQIGKAPETKT